MKISPDELIKDDAEPVMERASVVIPRRGTENGMLVYEGEGTRIELPPTEKGYELFDRLITNLIQGRAKELNLTLPNPNYKPEEEEATEAN